MTELFKLDKFLDALKEVGNIGAGKASGALSRIIDKKVILHTPDIFLTKTVDIPDLTGGSQELVVGIYNSLSGDVSGTLLMVIPSNSALELIDLQSGKKRGTTTALDKSGQAKLKKMGDVMGSSYLKSIVDFLKLKVKASDERIVSTFGESLPDVILFGIKEKYALFINTDFEVQGTKIKGKIIMLLAVDSINKMIEALQKQVG